MEVVRIITLGFNSSTDAKRVLGRVQVDCIEHVPIPNFQHGIQVINYTTAAVWFLGSAVMSRVSMAPRPRRPSTITRQRRQHCSQDLGKHVVVPMGLVRAEAYTLNQKS